MTEAWFCMNQAKCCYMVVPTCLLYLPPPYPQMSSGLMSGGLMSDGLMSGGLLSGGLMSGGLMSGGLMSDGLMSGGLMSGGLMSGGLMSGGTMSDGLMSGGLMSGGLMSGGPMPGGLMSGGPMSGGLMSAHRAPQYSAMKIKRLFRDTNRRNRGASVSMYILHSNGGIVCIVAMSYSDYSGQWAIYRSVV